MQALEGVAGAVTAVTGFEKGSGKTTFLSLALPHARRAGPVALFTIGSEGGPTRDSGGKATSPRIRVEPGDVVLTTEPLARTAQARFEILETVPGRTSLGRLLLGRARRGGTVQLVGAEHFSALAGALALVRTEGWARSALIDGAASRVTQIAALEEEPSAGTLGGLQFAYTVRVDRSNLARATARMQMLDRLARLPLASGQEADLLHLEGPLTSEGLRNLPQGTRGLTLQDFTKVFTEPQEFLRALDRYEIRVRRSFHLLCFAVALRDLGRDEFLRALGPEAAPRVLFNPCEAD